MTTLQKIQLRQSECRQRLRVLADKDDPSEAELTEIGELKTELTGLEQRAQAAILADADADQGDADQGDDQGGDDDDDGMPWDLIDQVDLGDYLDGAVRMRAVTGAAAELRQELDLDEEMTPLVLLMDRDDPETRADAATSAPTTTNVMQGTIAERVFGAGVARFLQVAMPDVPAGQASFPALTAGVTPSTPAAGAAVDAVAATFAATALTPQRVTARYLVNLEDVYSFRGMEAALRRDLRDSLQNALDYQVLRRTTAPKGLMGGITGLTDPADPGAVTTVLDFAREAASFVDGAYAPDLQAVRMLLGSESYAHLVQGTIGQAGSGALELLDTKLGAYRVSNNVAAADGTTTVQSNLLVRGRNAAVAPIWQGVRVIRDEVSGAASGQVALTAHLFYNFVVPRGAGQQYKLFKTRSSTSG